MVTHPVLLYTFNIVRYLRKRDSELDKTLQPKNLKGVWFGGDSSGWTHSLSQAAASGLYIADQVLIHYND